MNQSLQGSIFFYRKNNLKRYDKQIIFPLVLFKNRYHFESDYSKYLPTITFENGPIEVEVMWPNAIETSQIPSLIDQVMQSTLKKNVMIF